MRTHRVEVEVWRSFLGTFSRTHQGWEASLEVHKTGEPPRTEVDASSFGGTRLEMRHGRECLIFLFGDEPEEQFASMLPGPCSLMSAEQEDGSEATLVVEGIDGTRAVLLLTRAVERLVRA